MGKGTCHRVGGPEFKSKHPHGRKDSNLTRCPVTTTCVLMVHVHMYIHTKLINKCKKIKKCFTLKTNIKEKIFNLKMFMKFLKTNEENQGDFYKRQKSQWYKILLP